MRVVITGATSMIGVEVVKACIEKEWHVLAVVRKNSKNICRLPQSDLLETKEISLEDLCGAKDIAESYDVLIHLAWDYTTREGRYDVCGQEHNIHYTLQAVKLAQQLHCKKFIGVGSQAEYGTVCGVIDDQTPLNPEIPYGIAKAAAYRLSKELCRQYGIKHYWGRVFSVYGKHDHEGTLLMYAIDRFLQKEPAKFSSGMQSWNFIEARDAGGMLAAIAQTENLPEDVYFIANCENRRLRDYIMEVIRQFGETAVYEFSEEKTGGYGIQPDMERTNTLLGYQYRIPFEQGIAEMIEARANRTRP